MARVESLVKEKFDSYPDHVRPLLLNLREQIYQVAENLALGEIEESLKWGEPSYLSQRGSAIRLGWNAKYPEQYCLYFNCQTKLVDTFRELYGDCLKFQGNRAIEFQLTDSIPKSTIQHCIQLALTYKKIRHLPLLGV